MTSETETSLSQNSQPIVRLGLCEVCNHTEAKYTCPKCEVKTCCVRCLQIHKKELDCNGIRDKTKFIPIRDMTKRDFASDYTFLEECTRYVADRKRDQLKRHTRYNKTLPAHLFKLRAAANERRTQLRFLLALFSRHTANTTFYDWKTHVIRWRVEWVFPNADGVRFTDARCDERQPLQQLLRKYCELQRPEPVAVATAADTKGETAKPVGDEQLEPQTDAMRKALEFYQSRGVAAMRVLLKAEGIRRSGTRYWELDGKRTLRENLAGKTIVEFPVMYVVYDDVVKEFDVIDSDEDVAAETERHKLELETTSSSSKPRHRSATSVVGLNNELSELKLKKRHPERRDRPAKSTKNLMFAELGEEGASDENDSEADDGNETEEEEEEREQQGNAKDVSVRFVADDEEYEDVLEAKRMKLGAE